MLQPGFVLLASPREQHGLGRWVVATEPREVTTRFKDIGTWDPTGLVVGFVGYTSLRHTFYLPAGPPPLGFPEVWFARYERFWIGSPGEGFRELPEGHFSPPPLPSPRPGSLRFVRILEDETAYRKKILHIQKHLRQGNIYQANYTVPSLWHLEGSPWGVFLHLLKKQPTAFAAFLQISSEHAVLSFSPELFFHRQGNRIRTVPMKGTRPRGGHPGGRPPPAGRTPELRKRSGGERDDRGPSPERPWKNRPSRQSLCSGPFPGGGFPHRPPDDFGGGGGRD